MTAATHSHARTAWRTQVGLRGSGEPGVTVAPIGRSCRVGGGWDCSRQQGSVVRVPWSVPRRRRPCAWRHGACETYSWGYDGAMNTYDGIILGTGHNALVLQA